MLKLQSFPRSRTVLLSTARLFSHASINQKSVEWFAYIPERPNTDRSAFRAKHLENIHQAILNGKKITHGGALFTEVPIPGEPLPAFAGSVVQMEAESKEEVLKFLEQDVYNKMGVWDLKRAVILPCAIAFSIPRDVFAAKEKK
ncbi:hypothetical protein WICPIJ_008117 [Wickerhamomyces pijperi]|uniref:YCII-related domain-containing protein n=1 Tax=Wickerhamomyces pijperi TaxID=599730 RepID=A0A9P8PYN3_WICPI|nr:hypothetical protein WICPIJ_008117 [Wickerhamomyces pijperi]